MATSRRALSGDGIDGTALAFGGFTSSDSNATEEFTGGTITQTFTTSA